MEKIEMGKTYKTRSGLPVRILCTDKGDYCPVVAVVAGDVLTYTSCGRLHSGRPDEHDLVEYSLWHDVAVDAKIFVRDDESHSRIPRHFAKYENGKVYGWSHGCTSHTEKDFVGWNYATLAE